MIAVAPHAGDRAQHARLIASPDRSIAGSSTAAAGRAPRPVPSRYRSASGVRGLEDLHAPYVDRLEGVPTCEKFIDECVSDGKCTDPCVERKVYGPAYWTESARTRVFERKCTDPRVGRKVHGPAC